MVGLLKIQVNVLKKVGPMSSFFRPKVKNPKVGSFLRRLIARKSALK